MYKIAYHFRIPKDLEQIPNKQKGAIKKAIDTKLSSNPKFFGKPLQFTLQGLRSLRVGDYRIVFQLTENEVFVVLIRHRSKVYKEVDKRL